MIADRMYIVHKEPSEALQIFARLACTNLKLDQFRTREDTLSHCLIIHHHHQHLKSNAEDTREGLQE